jgi:hypothetical protein
MSSHSVTTFLGAVRRRLWLETLLRQLQFAAWASSGTFLLLALVHVTWGKPDFSSALVAALTAGLIALLPVLFARASLAECALRSDRHFGGYSLVTTAHELGRATDPGPAETIVMKRARSATADWRRRLNTLWQIPDGVGYVVAVIPVFFAALMFELPPKQEGHLAALDEQFGLAGSPASETDMFHNESGLPELREAIARNAIEERGSSQQEAVTRDNISPVPGDAAPEPGAETLEAGESDAMLAGFASVANGDGRSAGDARRRPGEIESRRDDSAPVFSEQIDIAIARHGAISAGRSDGGDEFGAGSQGSRLTYSNIVPAAAPPASSAWTTLTTAEVAYARRYLDAAGFRHE